MSRPRASREGMALLTVLLLVAVMAVVAVAILDDVRFSVRRTTNAETQAQAQWYAAGAESLARRQITDLLKVDAARTPIEPRWNGRVMEFPVEEGTIRAVVTDGQNCFNLNSLVYGQGEDLFARPEGTAQFIALGTALGLSRARMAAAAAALTDWMDNDAEASPGGAEDARYAGLATPYRTGGVMLADVSEMRAVANIDAALYRRLRPYVCALPTTAQARLNPNTLTPAQAPLLVMLTGGEIGLQTARAAAAARPAAGWASMDAFWAQPALKSFTPDEETQAQVSLLTRYFDLRVDIDYGGAHAVRTALLYAAPDGAVRTVIRRWTPEE
ncbi:type II secretion system protein K [Brevundimonas intermedia]|uniref:Type II secretion system protein K n=1 Tax=Brevundimonas intermedia TaxID=74315 RepID=A0ABQ5TD68_9CAUL|nr:type II secretion system minor pseudopilin GspK [Brevundimonas intermedia]GLK50298.1 type II secretion system protein K [Brevundimonas intermedia]